LAGPAAVLVQLAVEMEPFEDELDRRSYRRRIAADLQLVDRFLDPFQMLS